MGVVGVSWRDDLRVVPDSNPDHLLRLSFQTHGRQRRSLQILLEAEPPSTPPSCVLEGETEANRERFTSRFEAFSDLVFGFSLSLLATRLGVPARPEDIFEKTRWLAIIVTFALVCRFWLEHYRIFRHRFVAGMFDATLNFVFLFGIAVLPYAVECFLRFRLVFASFALYVGDFALILVSLRLCGFAVCSNGVLILRWRIGCALGSVH